MTQEHKSCLFSQFYLLLEENRFIPQSNNMKGLIRAIENHFFLNFIWLILQNTSLFLCDRLGSTDIKSHNGDHGNVIQCFVK